MAVKQGLLCPLCCAKRRSDLRNPALLAVWAEDRDIKWRYRGSLPWFDFCGDCHEKLWVNDSRLGSALRASRRGRLNFASCTLVFTHTIYKLEVGHVFGMLGLRPDPWSFHGYVRAAPPEFAEEPAAKPELSSSSRSSSSSGHGYCITFYGTLHIPTLSQPQVPYNMRERATAVLAILRATLRMGQTRAETKHRDSARGGDFF